MTESPITKLPPPPTAAVWVERQAPRIYYGRNQRGGEVLIGPAAVEEAFTPGELLQLGLAGCVGLTVDSAISRHLGSDVPATIAVFADHHPTDERYSALTEHLVIDLSGLSPQGQ
ncbi:MAG: hypothetical protein LBL92_06275, partial [Propionibacteriaceae bacterium]|nr:hypothetical protein [Propionibacteriaceae bacterium]